MQKSMKLNKNMLKVMLMCFTFYEPSIIPHGIFLAVKYSVIIWMILCYYKVIKKKKAVCSAAGIYGSVNILSSIINGMHGNTIVASIFFALQILSVFLVSEYMIEKYTAKRYIKWLLLYFFAICILTDLCMLFFKYDFTDPSEEYLIGNKFVVSYVHCFTAALMFAHFGNANFRRLHSGFSRATLTKQMMSLVFSCYTILICSKVTCTTGVIISLLLVLLMLLPPKFIKLFSSGKIMIIAMAVVMILMFGSASLLSNAHVLAFVKNVLGKSMNFTGRVQIWSIIFGMIVKQPILGYGYYNNLVENMLGYGNPQNGILKCLLDTGVIGLLAYAWLVIKAFAKKQNDEDERLPMVAFFITMLVASLVEINLTHMVVFLSMAITNSSAKQSRQNQRALRC